MNNSSNIASLYHLIRLEDPAYPERLKHITKPPPLLYVLGNPAYLSQPQLAIVGTRQPSINALHLAHYFADALSKAGLVITSGLAMGIDSAAHEGALARKQPTIAILGSGLDKKHLEKKRTLCQKISTYGALVSEFPPDTPPRPQHFPQRNRIISGLSLGVLVIEAAMKSGSLITARCATEQGRDVFAIPGSILNPMTAGCHHLIQQGAKLTTSVDDILSEIQHLFIKKSCNPSKIEATCPTKSGAELSQEQRQLLEYVQFESTSFEHLVHATGFSSQKITSLLCSLQLYGYIKEDRSGFTRIM